MDNRSNNQQGKMIGRYQLVHPLGRGGMGEVWLANDAQLQRQVALKLLPATLANNRAYLDEFSYEARASAALEHPHIITIHDFGEHQTADGEIIPFLVMPYVTGGTLRTRMQAANNRLPVHDCLKYLKQAALAIDYAHSKQVLHRDIKPANMLLQQDWLLLADFGIAKVLSSATYRGKTHAGAGTPEYMAPEQISGHAEPASDRYSLAVIAYQLFTGYLPFHGETPYETFTKQVNEPPPPPRRFNTTIPLEIEHILLLGLAKRVEDRPPTCLVFVEALERGWMSRFSNPSDPDATVLAPWSKRWEEAGQGQLQASSQHLPTPTPAPLPPPPAPGISGPHTPVISTPFGSTGSSPQVPLIPASSSPHYPPLPPPQAPMGPQIVANAPISHSAPSFDTISSPPSTPLLAHTGSQPVLPAASPQAEDHKVSRRRVIIGSSVIAAAVLAAGVTGVVLLSHQPAPAPQPAAPQPGPKNLIAGIPQLILTGHKDEVWSAHWDPSGRYLATTGKGTDIMIWDIASALQHSTTTHEIAKPLHTLSVAGIDFKDVTSGICWSADGSKLIAANTMSEKIYTIDPFAKSPAPTAYSDTEVVNSGATIIYNSVCPGPQKDTFSVSTDKLVHIWHIGQTDAPISTLYYDLALGYIGDLSWSPDASTLAAIGSSFGGAPKLLLWPNKRQAHAQQFDLPARNQGITFFALTDTVAWSPVDSHLVLISDGDIAVVWDTHQNKAILGIGDPAHAPATPAIGRLCWSPNGRYVASTYTVLGNTNAVHRLSPKILVWDIDQLRKKPFSHDIQPPTLSFGQQGSMQHTQSILDIRWSPDGRYLATTSLDKTVIIWKVDGG